MAGYAGGQRHRSVHYLSGGLAVDGAAYRFIMLRFRKTGKPVWAGEIRWVSASENFNNTKRYIVAEPEYADGVATLTVRDIPWTGNIDRIHGPDGEPAGCQQLYRIRLDRRWPASTRHQYGGFAGCAQYAE